MSNPTRQEIIDAYAALEELSKRSLGTHYVEMPILKALPPKPRPTMAEVEWGDGLHYPAEAEHVTLGKVVMLHPAPETRIRCLCKWYGPHWVYNLTPAHLTPTGKRYTLTEVQE